MIYVIAQCETNQNQGQTQATELTTVLHSAKQYLLGCVDCWRAS